MVASNVSVQPALCCDEFLWHSLPDIRVQSRNKVLQSGFQPIATLSQVVSPDEKSPITHAVAAGTRLAYDCESELLCEGCEPSFPTARLTLR